MNCKSIVFSDHAITQMFKRSIRVDDVKQIIEIGELISEYPNDKPYPSFLLSGLVNGRALHLVVAKNMSDNICTIVTAYEPTLDIWENDFKTKRKLL